MRNTSETNIFDARRHDAHGQCTFIAFFLASSVARLDVVSATTCLMHTNLLARPSVA